MAKMAGKMSIVLEIKNLEEVKKEINEIIKMLDNLRFKITSEVTWDEKDA
jgi:hypothetical protein